MNIRKIIAVALAAAFAVTASAEGKKLQLPKKTNLKKENAQLKIELDSLRNELEKYRMELAYADSIANGLVGGFEEEELKDSDFIAPEDYTAEVSDSLFTLWHSNSQTRDEYIDEYNLDSVRFQSNVPDEVYIERLKRMGSFITLPYNDIVKNYIILYSEKMPTKMSQMLGLCKYYMPIFEETLNRHGMPEELKAMAIIESALNPRATSRVGAKGLWQFMYATAKMYGLQIDSFVDERTDPVKSSEAAAKYMKDAYRIFGDWNLAIASYNCGAGNVNKAIRRSGGSREFWDIYPYLPRETRGYVPAFVGALYTMTYYKEHGIRPEAIDMPTAVDTFKINKMLHLKQVSDLTGAPLEELKELNPQYTHQIIPGDSKEYILKLPYKYSNSFIDHEDSIYVHKADEYFNPVTLKKIKDGADGERIVYRVQSGDYLGRIASRHRCTVAQIKRWNNLTSNNIRVGQRLVIYRGGSAPASASSSSSKSSTASKSASSAPAVTATANGEYLVYTIQSGDSIYSIAKNYPGISANDIMNFNGLSSSKIKPGMKIKIPKK